MPANPGTCVLYVEKDEVAVRLFQHALGDAPLHCEMVRFADCAQAIPFLLRTGFHHDTPRPLLILLGLNLESTSGFDTLLAVTAAAQSQTELKRVPIYVFSTSDFPEDRRKAIALGARQYTVKQPDTYKKMACMVREFLQDVSRDKP